MPTIYVTTLDGQEHALEAEVGVSVMEVITQQGLPMEAICGGCLSCATCHVYLDEEGAGLFEPKDEDEEDMLDLALNVEEGSRLSCQLKIADKHDGLRIRLAEE